MVATLSDVSKYVVMEINSFLTPAEAINFAATTKTIKDDLDLATIEDNFSHDLSDKRWIGGHSDGDTTRNWFRFMPLFCQDRIHTIEFTADCVDQGWGNRKSMLFLFEEDKSVEHRRGQIVAQSHLLEHHSTPVRFEFIPKPDKNYLLCYKVGGGGGHELIVRNPKIRLLICDSRGIGRAAQIFQKKEVHDMLKTSFFAANMMAGVVGSLKNSMECNLEQDKFLLSPFSLIGVDTIDRVLLTGMDSYLTECLKVFQRRVELGSDTTIEEQASSGDSLFSEDHDYASSVGSY